MKTTKKLHIGLQETIKATKIANREVSLENATGFVAINKSHKSIKDYTRSPKHKKNLLFF